MRPKLKDSKRRSHLAGISSEGHAASGVGLSSRLSEDFVKLATAIPFASNYNLDRQFISCTWNFTQILGFSFLSQVMQSCSVCANTSDTSMTAITKHLYQKFCKFDFVA